MTHLSDLIAALRKGDGNGCERSNWLMQEAADALMANQGAIVNSIIERTRHEATDDEREALAINYCPEHGDLLNRPDGTDARSHRCRNAHEIDEIHARFRRTDVPEPSAESLGYYDPARQDRISEHDCVFEDGEWWFGHGMLCKHPKLHAEPQGEPSDAQTLVASHEELCGCVLDDCEFKTGWRAALRAVGGAR